jgi:hypothetical protein
MPPLARLILQTGLAQTSRSVDDRLVRWALHIAIQTTDICSRGLAHELVELNAIQDLYMPLVPHTNNSQRFESAERSTHDFGRQGDVFADIRSAHRQINLARPAGVASLNTLDHLEEHREPAEGAASTDQKSVTLHASQFVAQLANNMKPNTGILKQKTL